ncbi:MAG: hypothetical protein GF421_10345 [Candidatus Aminicenantes bacterium]|nr:hypothetical protein [Candidatus Aminicenantes bacterium]
MKKTNKKCFFVLVFFLILSMSLASSFEQSPSLSQEETEQFLLTAEILKIEKELELGRTDFWRITLNNGKTERRAIFKHVNRSRPTLLPDCYKYEIAAYRLNKMIGLDVVPPVVERIINGQIGSLQLMIENVFTDRERHIKDLDPIDPVRFDKDMDVIKILEILACDQCSDSEDILIQADTWKLWRVDFSEAFDDSPQIPHECRIERCSRSLFDQLINLSNRKLEKNLEPYLNKKEINALLERKQSIITVIKSLIKQKGEKQVLFE